MDKALIGFLKSLLPNSLELLLPGAKEFTLLCICSQLIIALFNMLEKKKQNDLHGKRRDL